MVEGRRKYFNISQEGKSDIDFLREEELLNGLKMSSKSYQPITCYQISEKGLDLLGKIGKPDKAPVNDTVYAPGTRNLLQVEWDGEEYWLGDVDSGYRRISTVTETEDVSYVSSAYVPQCLRRGGRPTLSNAHRAHECGVSNSSIRDELDEIITLNSVSVIVSEFIPFGANQMVQLNCNVGSAERVQGGFFSAVIDDSSAETQLTVEPGLTAINVLDYSNTNHLNFEADIHFPEAPGIVQVETFGCALNAAGTCFYGMQIEAIMDRIKDNISLDHLSRLLVDVHIDSSQIIDSVLSPFQRSLLDLIFTGDAPNRDKVNLIIANEITPHLTAEEYLDKGEYENELKQVLGDTRAAYDISEHDTLIFGAHGLLIAGPNSRHHEPLLCAYLEFESMSIFTQNFFGRTFVLVDDMNHVRELIRYVDKDPNRHGDIREKLDKLSKEINLLDATLGYLRESIECAEIPPEPPEQAGRSLYDRLQIAEMRENILKRTQDLQKNIVGAQLDMQMLDEQSRVAREVRNHKQGLEQKHYARLQTELLKDPQKITTVRGILYLVAGLVTSDLMSKFTGSISIGATDSAALQSFKNQFVTNSTGVWFIFTLLFWGVIGATLYAIVQHHVRKNLGRLEIRMIRMVPIDTKALASHLRSKNIIDETHLYENNVRVAKVTWMEKKKKEWGGYAPRVEIEYDEENAFLLQVSVSYSKRQANKRLAFTAQELHTKLMQVSRVQYDTVMADLVGTRTSIRGKYLGSWIPTRLRTPRNPFHKNPTNPMTRTNLQNRYIFSCDGFGLLLFQLPTTTSFDSCFDTGRSLFSMWVVREVASLPNAANPKQIRVSYSNVMLVVPVSNTQSRLHMKNHSFS